MDTPARRHRHGRHDAPRRLRGRAAPGLAGGRGLRRDRRVRAPPPPLRVQPPLPQPVRGSRPLAARARRPTAAWSSSSSSTATRSGSAPRPTPSSRAGPTGRPRCSASSSAPRCDRAEGRTPHLFDLDAGSRARRRRLTVARGSATARRPRSWPRWPPSSASSTAARFEAPDGTTFERDVVHHPGAVSVVPAARRRRHRGPACASTAAPSTPSCSRSRPGSATSTARTPRPPPAASCRGGRPAAPAASSCWPSSTTRRASATSTRARSWPPASTEVRHDRQGVEEQHMTDRAPAPRRRARP